MSEDGSVAVLAAATTSVADAKEGEALLSVVAAFAVNVTLAPSGAAVETGIETNSGVAGATGRFAIVQVVPLADGQMAKLGVPR